MQKAQSKNGLAEEYKVGIADLKAAPSPHHIVTLGLGSCVGVILYDKITKNGGMVHIMLPDSTQFNKSNNPAKFADQGITLLLEEVLKLGAKKNSITAKIAGGAQMFKGHTSSLLNIGERNVKKTKDILSSLNIPLLAEETGGHIGRTLIHQNDTGRTFVRSIGDTLREI